MPKPETKIIEPITDGDMEEVSKEILKKNNIKQHMPRPLNAPKATHRGNFEKDFGIPADFYILNDNKKTVVISQRGLGNALGLTGGGGLAIIRLVSGQALQRYIGPELQEKMANPLIFQPLGGGPIMGKGYDITILIDIVKAIIQADADGIWTRESQKLMVAQANIILGASAKTGIKMLAYALAGYHPEAQEVIEAFKFAVREEAREYESEFSDELYYQWYRIYKIPVPIRNKPWKFKHLTLNQVYYPLAKSRGVILKLMQQARGENRAKKLHQFLTDVGVKALRQHLGTLIGIAKLSKDQREYENNLKKVFGEDEQLSLNFEIEEENNK